MAQVFGKDYNKRELMRLIGDVSQASYCGKSLCWRSSIGEVHPHFFEPEGMGWARSFLGGLLTTCGLTYCGAPCEDEGEKLGLHGRISHIPADKVSLEEKCYYHKMREDSSGLVQCALVNENLEGNGFGFYVKYKKEQLPQFVEWKMMGEGTYVVGMEPANCLVEGRDELRKKGTLEFLEPREKKEFELEIGVLNGKKAIDRFKAEVKVI